MTFQDPCQSKGLQKFINLYLLVASIFFRDKRYFITPTPLNNTDVKDHIDPLLYRCAKEEQINQQIHSRGYNTSVAGLQIFSLD